MHFCMTFCMDADAGSGAAAADDVTEQTTNADDAMIVADGQRDALTQRDGQRGGDGGGGGDGGDAIVVDDDEGTRERECEGQGACAGCAGVGAWGGEATVCQRCGPSEEGGLGAGGKAVTL